MIPKISEEVFQDFQLLDDCPEDLDEKTKMVVGDCEKFAKLQPTLYAVLLNHGVGFGRQVFDKLKDTPFSLEDVIVHCQWMAIQSARFTHDLIGFQIKCDNLREKNEEDTTDFSGNSG